MASTAMFAGLTGCGNQSEQQNNGAASSTADGANAASSAGAAAQPNASAPGTAAVVYFSCTGNTRTVAEKIAQAVGVAPEEIIPAEPYTADDLNYNVDCRANAEQNEGTARPELAAPIPDVADAEVVYLGYPIWWGTVPRIVLTYLEQTDVAGKTIVPFCTSGGSGIEGSLPEIEAAAAGAAVEDARRFSSSISQDEIDAWVASTR